MLLRSMAMFLDRLRPWKDHSIVDGYGDAVDLDGTRRLDVEGGRRLDLHRASRPLVRNPVAGALMFDLELLLPWSVVDEQLMMGLR
jgi:hypothetical protein